MINIMTIGNTGSGKSELIKSIFGLDIETNIGMSVTQKITQYMVKDKPLSIYDTVGFEFCRNEMIKEEIIQLIVNKSKSIDPSNHIHIVWYVINEGMSRIQDNDIKVIKEIMNLKIPVIIILNNSQLINYEMMDYLMNGKIINDICVPNLQLIYRSSSYDQKQLIKRNIAAINTNAKETKDDDGRTMVPAYGANNLINLTRLYIKNAENIAFQASINNLEIKSEHIKSKVIQKYKKEINLRWIFSPEYRKTIFDNALRKMITEIINIYNINWDISMVLEIINKFYEEGEWFKSKTDELYGGMLFFGAFPTEKEAIKFISKCGKTINQSFYQMLKNGENMTTISFISKAEETISFENYLFSLS